MSSSNGTVKVLVADDSAVYRKLVEYSLSHDPYSVLFAKSGAEAIQLHKDHQFAVIVTDWNMPDLTGIELCQRIRADSHDPYTYIILLTTASDKQKVIEGLAAGADDYLTKPFDPGELLARVGVGRRIIDLHRQIEAKNRLLEELAVTDSLTGLPNRRALEDRASRQLSGAIRHGHSFWVVMIDLDHFKNVNDAHGHDAGDVVLKKFSEILNANTRSADICGRFGGEEFLLVLTHADEEGVRVALERIRKQLEEHRFQFGNATFGVTASFGASAWERKVAPEFQTLVNRADKALYTAKRLGRNRIQIDNG